MSCRGSPSSFIALSWRDLQIEEDVLRIEALERDLSESYETKTDEPRRRCRAVSIRKDEFQRWEGSRPVPRVTPQTDAQDFGVVEGWPRSVDRGQ